MADPVADAADRLYGLALDEFTPERDRAAKALRKEDRAAADAIGSLRKPAPQAWAANRVAREQPDVRDELLAAGQAVREAQEAALAGGGREQMRAAMPRMRDAIEAFLDAAREQRPGGRPLSDAAANRLRSTLQAAAADDAVRDGLAHGMLVGDAEAGGAWPLPGAGEAPSTSGKPAKRAPAKKTKKKAKASERDKAAERERDEAAEREREEAEQREREESAARRRELEERLRGARSDVKSRERELARAERESDRAARRLERALADAEEARTSAEEAASDADAAREAADDARHEVARLEEQLD